MEELALDEAEPLVVPNPGADELEIEEPALVDPGDVKPRNVELAFEVLKPRSPVPVPSEWGNVINVVGSLLVVVCGCRAANKFVSRFAFDGGFLGASGPNFSVSWARPKTHAFLLRIEAIA